MKWLQGDWTTDVPNIWNMHEVLLNNFNGSSVPRGTNSKKFQHNYTSNFHAFRDFRLQTSDLNSAFSCVSIPDPIEIIRSWITFDSSDLLVYHSLLEVTSIMVPWHALDRHARHSSATTNDISPVKLAKRYSHRPEWSHLQVYCSSRCAPQLSSSFSIWNELRQ